MRKALGFMVWLGVLLICSIVIRASEQCTTGWKKHFTGSAKLTQASFDNWAQGGENSLAWQVTIDTKLERQSEPLLWSNRLRVCYGMTKVGEAQARKSVDEVKFESVVSYRMGIYLDPYISFSASSQLTRSYSYSDETKQPISDLFDPLYLTEAFGLGYSTGKIFKTRLGLSLKQTFTDDFPQPFSDDPETPEVEKRKSEIGMESVSQFEFDLSENLRLSSELELFSNMKSISEVDVKWTNLLSARVAKYVDVTLSVDVLYDKDISVKRQIRQSLAIGLTYSAGDD